MEERFPTGWKRERGVCSRLCMASWCWSMYSPSTSISDGSSDTAVVQLLLPASEAGGLHAACCTEVGAGHTAVLGCSSEAMLGRVGLLAPVLTVNGAGGGTSLEYWMRALRVRDQDASGSGAACTVLGALLGLLLLLCGRRQ
jgi:hypothetical protein